MFNLLFSLKTLTRVRYYWFVLPKSGVSYLNFFVQRESRTEYTALAKEFRIPARCFYFNVSRPLAQHMNEYREALYMQKAVPTIVYNIFQSKFVVPTVSEGFSDIICPPFLPRFENDDEKSLFKCFYEIDGYFVV